MSASRPIAIAACLMALCAGSAAAATPLQLYSTSGAGATARSYLLTLPRPRALDAAAVTVTQNGHPVRDLTVSRVGASSQSSSALVIEIDESLTMRGLPVAGALAASRRIVEQAGPDEQIAIVAFNRTITVLAPFTTDHALLDAALRSAPTFRYGTRYEDALERGVELLGGANAASGSIILFANGRNVGSTVSGSAARAALTNAHVRVFTLALSSPVLVGAPLAELAAATGGSYSQATDVAAELRDGSRLGSTLAGEYLLRYRSFVNPATHVRVAVSVHGIQGAAVATYVSPALHLTPAPAYVPPPPPKQTFARSPWALLVVVAIIAALVFGVIRILLGPRRQPVIDRIGEFVTLGGVDYGAGNRGPNPNGLLGRAQASIESQSWSAQLAESLELADITMPVGKFVLFVGGATVLGALLGNLTFGTIGLVAGLCLVPFVARVYVRRALKRKRKAFADQLPDSLDVLASALRAGNSLVGGLSVVAEDAAEPIRAELRRVLTEEQLGVQIEDALMVTAARMGNRDVEQLSLVARLQREMGANTAEVLDRVVETVRGRMELRRLVSSLTAQGRLSRWILTLMPVAIAVLIDTIDPGYMSPLFDTTIGEGLLGFAVVMVSMGSFIIGKIVDIKA